MNRKVFREEKTEKSSIKSNPTTDFSPLQTAMKYRKKKENKDRKHEKERRKEERREK